MAPSRRSLALFAGAISLGVALLFASAESGIIPNSDALLPDNLNFLQRRQSAPPAPTGTPAPNGPSSPQVLPAPNVTATGDWAAAIKKARAFVKQLTLEEKVNITTGADIFTKCVGNTGSIPRLGFDGFCLNDSPLGVRFADYVSVFPAGINTAMTWDHDLMYFRGAAMGQENRGKGVNVHLGPMMNMGRLAAAGRNWEGFGADPYLTGVAAARTVEGVQDQGVIACAKHFVGNEQEHSRGGSLGSPNAQAISSDIDDRTMHEIYAWPFAESVLANVGSIMCSYQRVNGTFACENSKIINGIAKEELDFKGFLLTDWAAMVDGLASAITGVDMNMPGFIGYGIGDQDQRNPAIANNSFWGAALVELVRNGTVPEWRVDDMVTRSMSAFFFVGQDKGFPKTNFNHNTKATVFEGQVQNLHVNVQGNHSAVIREIGSASTILLKHEKSVLPLQKGKIPEQIVIIGSDAGPKPAGPNGCSDGNSDKGCDEGTLAVGWGSGQADFPYLVDPLSAIQTWILEESPHTNIQYLLNDFNLGQAATIASTSPLCMVFVNSDSGEGYINVGGNQGDRNNITLWHGGDELITTTANNCNNTIVVIHAVGPVLMEQWIEHPNVTAVLFAGLPGQESGNALVDVLKGHVNPSGRLPFTVAKRAEDYPAQVIYTAPSGVSVIHQPYTEKLEIDYRHFDAKNIEPRFEFGFGLSYTFFSYSGLSVKRTSTFGKRYEDALLEAETIASTRSGSSTPASSHPGSSSAASSSHLASSSKPASSSEPASSSTASSAKPSSSVAASSSVHVSSAASHSSAAASGSSSAVSGSSAPASHSGAASGTPTVSSPTPTDTFSFGPTVTPTGGIGGNPQLYHEALNVKFTIKNTGPVAGHEVAQLYISYPESAGEPPKVLRGFTRPKLNSKQSKQITLSARNKDLAIWDVVQQAWVIPAGQFTVHVGASSRDIRLSQTFSNNKAIRLSAS